MKTIKIRCKAARLVDYRKLNPFQGELKKLGDDNKQKLKDSIIDDGFLFPIHVWEDASGMLYTMDGHQRCIVLDELEKQDYEIPKVPVAIIQAADIAEAKKFLLRSLSQYGQMTEDGLIGYMQDAKIDVEFLDDLRLPDVDIDAVFEKLEVPDDPIPDDIDEAPHAPTVAISKRGQIYKLGDHRLMCGDATDPKDIAKLMKKERARMVFTDPPYGVSYKGVNNPNGREWEGIKNDDLRGDKLFEFLPIFYGIKEGSNCEWFGDRTAKTIQNLNRGNIEEMKKEQMQIICRAIKNSSQEGEIVLDLFGGSGSTLMACEITRRRCFTMEMDEKFCDIIVKRWEEHTGETAEKA